MEKQQNKAYPTILGAVHLVVLYIFIQTVVDFPLAVIDYYSGTDYLYNPVKKVVLGIGSILFILYFAYRKAKVRLSELFPLRFFNPFIILPLILIIWAGQNIIGEINVWVGKALPPPSWFWELFNKVFENDYGIYGAILKVAIIAPIVEESIFRGVIMHGLMRNYSKITAIVVSALMFALFHLNPWQFPATFTLGLLLGWLMVRMRNIVLCIIGHAINNGLVLLSINYADQISENAFYLSEKTLQWKVSLLTITFGLIIVSLLSWKRQKAGTSKST